MRGDHYFAVSDLSGLKRFTLEIADGGRSGANPSRRIASTGVDDKRPYTDVKLRTRTN